MILANVRLNWVKIALPDDKGNYGVTILVPKNSPAALQLLAARDLAIKKGIETKKFSKAQSMAATFKTGVRDGDEEAATEQQPPYYKGHWFINASNASQPGVVDANNLPANPNILYAGCVAHVDINVFPYFNQKENARGVTASIENIMFREDAERWDGRPTPKAATEAFAAFADSGEDTPDNDMFQA